MIQARDIRFSYKVGESRVEVLKGVNLSIQPGEMVAIRGSSGSGKSTLLYILGCLLKTDSGRLRLDGQEVSSLSTEELAFVRNRTIGFIFQQFHLLPRASVLDNILLPVLYPCETARPKEKWEELTARAKELAERLGLSEHLHHLPNQLSGGQQQRVAIARALMNGAKLILADEPTGNLDSKNAAAMIELLKELNRQGVTIVVVTHDPEVSKHCQREYFIKDGEFVQGGPSREHKDQVTVTGQGPLPANRKDHARMVRALLPMVSENLWRNKARSALTMLGITIGIAAVLAMLTVGQFTKKSMLASYEALGVNKMVIKGWPNFKRKAVDRVNVMFREFEWKTDVLPLRHIFPDIGLMSPFYNAWIGSIDFGGRSMATPPQLKGVDHEYFAISNIEMLIGSPISPYHIESRAGVCVIGYEVAKQLFAQVNPLGQVVYLTGNNRTAFGCRVIGVMRRVQSNNEWNSPDTHVLIPFTFFPLVVDSWWDTQLHEFIVQVKSGTDVEKTSTGIKAFYEQKYGKSGRFEAGSDAVLLSEMRRFMNLFMALLASIAVISLIVGGIGITNMMLVSVSERFKEIGLRKALGATDYSIRVQFLLESTTLCAVAGIVGILAGFTAYEGIIYAASKFVNKLKFEWLLDPTALCMSVASILAVGIASGLVPAVKAEKLEVIEALRSE